MERKVAQTSGGLQYQPEPETLLPIRGGKWTQLVICQQKFYLIPQSLQTTKYQFLIYFIAEEQKGQIMNVMGSIEGSAIQDGERTRLPPAVITSGTKGSSSKTATKTLIV